MRNFTNASVFDDTLPVSDGVLEVGAKMPLDQLQVEMEDWFRRKNYLPRTPKLNPWSALSPCRTQPLFKSCAHLCNSFHITSLICYEDFTSF
jgi:hypothetical protein